MKVFSRRIRKALSLGPPLKVLANVKEQLFCRFFNYVNGCPPCSSFHIPVMSDQVASDSDILNTYISTNACPEEDVRRTQIVHLSITKTQPRGKSCSGVKKLHWSFICNFESQFFRSFSDSKTI